MVLVYHAPARHSSPCICDICYSIHMRDDVRTPQINVSKIPGGEGVAGALFALISMVIFLVGIPALRFIFPAAIVLGCGIAVIRHFIRHETTGASWILPARKK